MALVRGAANFATHGNIPIKWSPLLIPTLDANVQSAKTHNRIHESEISMGGDIVRINQPPSFNSFNYLVDSPISWQLGTEKYIDLVIDQFLYNAVRIDVVDEAQSMFNVDSMYADRLEVSLATAIDRILINKAADGASALTTFGSPNTGQALGLNADNINAFLIDLVTRFKENRASSVDGTLPCMLITPSIYAQMLKFVSDKTMFSALRSDPSESLSNGFTMGDMEFRVSTNIDLVPATATTDSYYKLYAAYKYALTFAVGIQYSDKVETFQDYMAKGRRMLTVFGSRVTNPEAVAAIFCKTN